MAYQQQGYEGQGDSGCSVFVGNISYKTNEQDLRALFEQIGPVTRIRVIIDKQTGRSKGYGFCEYTSPDMANMAIQRLNGYEHNGRQLRVAPAQKQN
jgi:RNA recognition motif-containing protein